MKSCNICTEKFNRSSRSEVKCYCEFSACKTCWKTYILSIPDDAQCMSPECNIKFNRKFLCDNFSKSFVNSDYKVYIENVLFDREKQYLAEVQKTIELENNIKLITDKINIETYNRQSTVMLKTNVEYILNKLKKKLPCPIKNCKNKMLYVDLFCKECRLYIWQYFIEINQEHFSRVVKQIDINSIFQLQYINYEDECYDINFGNFSKDRMSSIYTLMIFRILRFTLSNRIDELEDIVDNLRKERDNKNYKKNSAAFTNYCPNNSCNGFLSDDFQCKICRTIACSECLEIKKNDNHECNEDTVKSLRLMRKDTKSCPRCSIPIHRKSGCQDMYCISCKTFFNWHTLKIYNRTVHNPEYTDQMSRITGFIPRNPNDILCGREFDHSFINEITDKIYTRTFKAFKYIQGKVYFGNIKYKNASVITNICSATNKFRDYINRHFIETTDSEQLRRKYIKGDIDKIYYKTTLQKNYKKNQKDSELLAVLRTFISCIIDLIYKLSDDISKPIDNKLIQYKETKKGNLLKEEKEIQKISKWEYRNTNIIDITSSDEDYDSDEKCSCECCNFESSDDETSDDENSKYKDEKDETGESFQRAKIYVNIVKESIHEMNELRLITNIELKNIANNYSVEPYMIDDDFELKTKNKVDSAISQVEIAQEIYKNAGGKIKNMKQEDRNIYHSYINARNRYALFR